MSEQPPPKRGRAKKPRYRWCDGNYRCPICPGGLGRHGRGFTRARSVPCLDPDSHLTLRDTDDLDLYMQGDMLHWDLGQAKQLNRGAGEAIKAGPQGWCVCCDPFQRYKNGRPQPPPCPTVVSSHVGQWPPQWDKTDAARRLGRDKPPQRARKAQLPWCDGMYRCVICAPKGQTRPIGSAQCTDPAAHMPMGLRGQFVHFEPTHTSANALLTGGAHAQLYITSRAAGCGRCAGSPPDNYDRR